MTSLRIEVRLVDGSQHEIPGNLALLTKLSKLERRGLAGKQLIHELLTDDWGTPPKVVVISGTGHDGKAVNVRIPYR